MIDLFTKKSFDVTEGRFFCYNGRTVTLLYVIGSKIPVVTTRTKAEYDDIYSFVRVRQVICYSKAGKKLYDSGDDRSAG